MIDLSNVTWRKSTRSGNGGNCVEVGFFDAGTVGVRDSKDKTGPVLTFGSDEWDAFLAGVSNGEFSVPAHIAA